MWWTQLLPTDPHQRVAIGILLAIVMISLLSRLLAPNTTTPADYDAAYRRRVKDLTRQSLNSMQLASQDADMLARLEHLVEAHTYMVSAGQLVSSDALASIAGLDDAPAYIDRIRRRRVKTVDALRRRCPTIAVAEAPA